MSVNAADVFAQLGVNTYATQSTEQKRKELGQADFLRLMTEQLKNQDPLKPMEGAEFLGQLAQFSTVQGIEGVNGSIQGLGAALDSSHTLQAAALIGRHAMVGSNVAPLAEGGTVAGMVVAEEAGPVVLEIKNASGQVVRRLETTADAAGAVDFEWDGCNAAGVKMPKGDYKISATVDGVEAETLIAAEVQSVSLGPTGVVLNLAGLGAVPMSALREIRG